jgi:magnesium chelatase subunit D
MNPEEGELRPQLLDRFGITAEVLTLRDPELRYEVVRRRLAFERDPIEFRRAWETYEQAEAQRIRQAASCLPEVGLDEALARSIAELCAAAGVDGLRGDLVIHKAAMALAAYAGRTEVTTEDVQEAAVLALAHRRRRRPFEPPGRSPSTPPSQPMGRTSDQPRSEAMARPPLSGVSQASEVRERSAASSQPRPPTANPQRRDGDDGPEWHFAPRGDGTLPQLAVKSRSRQSYGGTRQIGKDEGSRGPRIGTRPLQAGVYGALALDATIRAAARFQPRRRHHQDSLQSPLPLGEGQGEGASRRHERALTPTLSHREREKKPAAGRMVIWPQDLMVKVRRTPTQHLYILVVDASGSMAAYQRMAQVKGMLLGLLREVYRHRDGVAVIAFRGAQSELLLSPTRSPEAAQAFIEALPTGGRTPLAHALLRVEALMTHERRRQSPWLPILVLVTDGRPNRGLTRADPLAESLSICRRLADSGLHAVVVDTEAGAIRLGLAMQFAKALSASYVRLEQLLREAL